MKRIGLVLLTALALGGITENVQADYRPQPNVQLPEQRYVRRGSTITDRWWEQLMQAVSETQSLALGQDSCDSLYLDKDSIDCTIIKDVCVKTEWRKQRSCGQWRVDDCGGTEEVCTEYKKVDVGFDIPYTQLDDIRQDGTFSDDNVYFQNKKGGSQYIDFKEEEQATHFASSLARVGYIAQKMAQDTRNPPLKMERDQYLQRKAQCAHQAYDNYSQGHATKLRAINLITACLGRQEEEVMEYLTKPGQYQDAVKDEAFRNIVGEVMQLSTETGWDFSL